MLVDMHCHTGWGSGDSHTDPNTLIKQAKADLRSAQNDKFNGNTGEAIKGVKGVAEILFKVRKLKPNHPKLSLLQSKTDSLRDDLQRKSGTTIALKTD